MKLIDSLSILDKTEWKSLRKFVQMELRPTSEAYLLFEQLYGRRNSIAKSGLSDKIKTAHFEKLTQKSYLNLYSILYQIFEDWLVYFDVRSESRKYQHILIKGLNDRGLYASADRVFDKISEDVQSDKFHKIENQEILSQILLEQYYSNNPIKYRNKELFEQAIMATIAYNKTMYSLLLVESYNWGNLKKIDFGELQEILIKTIDVLPEFEISRDFEFLLRMWIKNDLDSLKELSSNVINGKYGYKGFLVLCFGLYSIKKTTKLITKGKTELKQLLLDLYNFAFEYGLLTDRKAMSAKRFMTTVHNLSVLLPKEDIYPLIEKWYRDVPYKDSDSLYRLCEMIVAFQQKRFDNLLELQRENLHLLIDEQLRFLALRLVALYENKPSTYEQLTKEIQGAKRFLKRNREKTTDTFYSNVKNLVYYIEELNDYRFSNNKPSLALDRFMLHRSWAIEKLTELK